MTKLEEVARALCEADGLDPDADWRDGDGVFLTVAIEPGKQQRWRTYVRKARAALEALRMPNEAMRRAGRAEDDWYARPYYECASETTHWIAMIDAILKEKP